MKKLILTVQLTAALFFSQILNSSVFAQNVISSINVSENATFISNQLTNSDSESDVNSIQFENWLTNKNYLDISSSTKEYKFMMVMNEKVYEKRREVESWMIDKSNWFLKTLELEFFEEKHPMIEDWMTDSSFWKIKQEVSREIEDWMLDEHFWVLNN